VSTPKFTERDADMVKQAATYASRLGHHRDARELESIARRLFVLVNPPEPEGDGGVLEGTNRTTSGAIGQP
jgi:hypothetical protein